MTGRPPILDPEKRQRLLSLLSVGCSRRIAAHYVGCSPSTITRTAGRDPAFADQVAQAESNLEIELLGAIRHAARNDRYWRAAAWLLERKNPQDFQKRPEKTFTPDQVTQLFAVVLGSLRGQLPAEQINLALHQLSTLLGEVNPNKTTTTHPTPEPSTPEPSIPEPSIPEPSSPEPSSPEPSTPEPSTPEPSTPEPSTPEPTTPEPSTPEPTTPEPPTPEPPTPEPSTPEPSTPEPSTPEPSTPEPSTPEPSTPPLSSPPTDPTNPWVAHSERERWVWIAESPRPSLGL